MRAWCLVLGLAVGCADGASLDAGASRDAGVIRDAATPDAANVDAALPDAGRDGGTRDAGPRDAGDRDASVIVASVGVYAAQSNYFELDTENAPLRFHFGSSNSRWGVLTWPVAGDFDGDGFDTVGRYDLFARQFLLADTNDSDEHGPRGTTVRLNIPGPPPVSADAVAELPVVGDWDGDGVDGVGLFHVASGRFFLRNDPSDGPSDIEFTFGFSQGWPSNAFPVAGDWDGDGDDEVGMFTAGTAFLRNTLTEGAPDLVYATGGVLPSAADFDGDGIDTIAAFRFTTNTFLVYDAHGGKAEEQTFGHVEPAFWSWIPIAGRWAVPTATVASRGFDWPTENAADHGFDAVRLQAALDDAETVASVTSVLVVRDNKLVGEVYHHGYARHIAGNIKSVSKSVLSALYGHALNATVLPAPETPVADLLPSYFGAGTDPAKLGITIADLMSMRGGLEWVEEPRYVSPLIVAPDAVAYVLGFPIVVPPGSRYNYSTGLTHVASAVLTEAAQTSTRDYATTNIFEPIGISVPRWDRSTEGYFIGGAEMWMRPRDLARFGQLYLSDGLLDGTRVLPSAWVARSGNPTIPEFSGRRYGLWWRERPWTNYAFDDSYFAWGYGGQFLFVFPRHDLIIVVTSKWSVDGATSAAAANMIFDYVDTRLLGAIQ